MSRVPVGSALVLGVSDLVVVGAWLDFLIGDFFGGLLTLPVL